MLLLFETALDFLSLSRGSIRNNLPTFDVEMRSLYSLPSPYPTLLEWMSEYFRSLPNFRLQCVIIVLIVWLSRMEGNRGNSEWKNIVIRDKY